MAESRQPRGMLTIGGQIVPGWTELEVDSHSFREADTFSVTLVLSALSSPYDEVWFCSQTTLSVEILIGFPVDPDNYGAGELDSLITGHVDSVEYDPAARELRLSGRDLTSLLIDAKTAEKWQNQTASEVATTLAQRHGLTPIVTATTEKLGVLYQIDRVTTTREQTEWDFLCWVAQLTQFVVYVKGNSLHFEPAPDPSKAPKYPITWTPADASQPFGSNTKSLSFSRTLTVGKTLSVTVRTWNAKQKKGFSASYPGHHAATIKPGMASNPTQQYSYIIPNLDQDAATKRAEAIYNELIKNEMRMTASLPGDNALDILHVMNVSGTGTVFDQTYFPQSISRHLSFPGGYKMDVQARNHSGDDTSEDG